MLQYVRWERRDTMLVDLCHALKELEKLLRKIRSCIGAMRLYIKKQERSKKVHQCEKAA